MVIGAGIGGLICAGTAGAGRPEGAAGRAALHGRRLLQHVPPRPLTFDAATHFYPLLGNPMTITGAAARELGVAHALGEDGSGRSLSLSRRQQLSVSADFDEYIEALKATFPHEAAALDRFFSEGSRSVHVRPAVLLPRPGARRVSARCAT